MPRKTRIRRKVEEELPIENISLSDESSEQPILTIVNSFFGKVSSSNNNVGLEKDESCISGPSDLKYRKITTSEAKVLENMEIVGVLTVAPASAMSAIRSKLDEEMVERNIFLCGISLIALGYLPTELKYVENWTMYDRKKKVVKNPEKGVYFIKSSTDLPLPVLSEFYPTANYLNKNPEVWEIIRKNFDFNKMFETHKSKVYGVSLLDCVDFKYYISRGGKLETICFYVDYCVLEFSDTIDDIMSECCADWPGRTNDEMKKEYPELYVYKWNTAMRSKAVQDESHLIHDKDNKGRGDPIGIFIKNMVADWNSTRKK